MTRNQKQFANPAISGPRQLRFNHTLDPRGYWGSIPTNMDPWRIRDMLRCIAVDRCWLDDPSELAIAVATGQMPAGYNSLVVQDLLEVDEHESLFPSKSNRVLHRIAQEIRKEVGDDAARREVPIDELPRHVEYAWNRRINGHMTAPPWISCPEVIDILEKNIRMRIYDVWPALKAAEAAEERLYELTSKVFLETGWHLVFDDDGKLPTPILTPEVRELVAEGNRALEEFSMIDWNRFIAAMAMPETAFEMGEEGGFLVPTVPGLFLDVNGLTGEDIEWIRDGVENLIGKARGHVTTFTWTDFATDPVYGHVERLFDFIRNTHSFQSPSPATAAATA